MNADLMGATCPGTAFEQGVTVEALADGDFSNAPFSALRIYAHQTQFARMRRKFGFDAESVLVGRTLDESAVDFERLFRAEGVREGDEGRLIFSEQENAARLKVQPMGVHQIIYISMFG